MDGKSDGDATEPSPDAETTAMSDASETRTPESPIADTVVDQPAVTETSRKAARKEARRQPLNSADPDPAWLSRGSGKRSLLGIGLVVVLVAAIGALGWVLFKPTEGTSTGPVKGSADNCPVTESDGEAAVEPPRSLGNNTAPRSTATVTTNRGVVTVLLFGDVSPCGVGNFEYLTKQGFYKNNACHRLTTQATDPTVTLRCGDPKSDGKGDAGYRMQAEDSFTGEVGRDYVAMINDRKGMAGSSFAFIRGESKPTASLSVIGQVIAGHEVLDQIGATAGVEGYDDVPKQPITIKKITIANGTVTLPPPGGRTSSGPTSGGSGDVPSGSGPPSDDTGSETDQDDKTTGPAQPS